MGSPIEVLPEQNDSQFLLGVWRLAERLRLDVKRLALNSVSDHSPRDILAKDLTSSNHGLTVMAIR